jgi:ABC-type molybdenum transport system ATPase subunit/photorepair protein PhrA
MIGHASPEIFAAFPRGMGLSAGEAIATGWEGVFSRRNVDLKKQERALRLLEPFQDLLISSVRQRPGADNSDRPDQAIRDIYNTDFGHFSPNHQALILFLRAIVARPKLLVLDEASQGMDEATWARCRKLLEQEWAEIAKEGGDQAVICVSHWEEEVPWEKGEGDVLRLHDGKVVTDTTKDALSI